MSSSPRAPSTACRARRLPATLCALMCAWRTAPLEAQTVTLPLTPAEWTATDSIRFETALGRPSIYINKGLALSRSARFRNGTLEFDMAAGPRSNNLGIAFRAQGADAFEVVYFRPAASGTIDAMQYAPAVLRWEYRPASTVFLVWQQERGRELEDGRFRIGGNLSNLFGAQASNALIVKVSYWFSR